MRLLVLPMVFLCKSLDSCASTASAANPVTVTTTTEGTGTTTTTLSTDTTTTVVTDTTTTTTSADTTTTTVSTECEAGWELFEGNCYFLGTDLLFQADAEAACEAMGATLTSIHSQAENDFVNTLAGGMTVWIGVTKICATGDMTCFQNIDGTPMDYTNFRPGQPDNFGAQNCIQMNWAGNTGTWDDIDCTASIVASASEYVCKKPL